jgi:hypothetical protein
MPQAMQTKTMADKYSSVLHETMSLMRPEEQIVVWSAKSSIEAKELENIRELLREDLDWNYLLRSGIRSRTFPLLYAHLNAELASLAPEDVVEQFSNRAKKIHARNLILTNELCRVSRLLQKNGIEPIPYKGPALAAILYGNIGLRQFTDLDILVKFSDVLKARNILLDEGYQPADDIEPMTPSQRRAFFHFHYTYDFHHKESGHRLEMHWGIVPRHFGIGLDYDQLWKRAVRTSFCNVSLLTLSPEDSLLILCVSGTKHLWNQIGRICDVAETIRIYPKLDWNLLLKNAEQLRIRRIVYLALYLSKHLFHASVPDVVWRKIEGDAVVAKLGKGLLQSLFTTEKDAFFQEEARFQPLILNVREKIADKLLYLLRLASTPSVEEWRVATLPGPLYFIYYLIRPVRLIIKYGWKWVRRYSMRIFNKTAYSTHSL